LHLLPLEHPPFPLQLRAPLLQSLERGRRQCALHLAAMPRPKLTHFLLMPFTQRAKRFPLLLGQHIPTTPRNSTAPLRCRCCRHAGDHCRHEQNSSRFHCCHPPGSNAPEFRRSSTWTARSSGR
jgi:hypothetical protein